VRTEPGAADPRLPRAGTCPPSPTSSVASCYATRVPLLLVDLDDTLIDRAAAFARWATKFAWLHRSGDDFAANAEWLIIADRDGFEDRKMLAAKIAARFGLPAGAIDDLADELRRGLVENMILDSAVADALTWASAAGWVPFVVTNGVAVAQQERKLRATGLDRLVAGWVISAGVGVSKPDPRIFQLAARRANMTLDGAWMIGDRPEADIAGARNAGIPSVWLDRGRPWTHWDFAPNHVASGFPEAIELICGRPDQQPDDNES
jgi:putative hydrolase of the HAD superfamily